jgi:DNA polymerase type B, organellar and viral
MQTERPWHLLPGMTSATLPTRTLCFSVLPKIREVEAGLSEHTFRIGHASTQWWVKGRLVDRLETVLRRPDDLFSWVRRTGANDRSTWVFSHNLGYGCTLLGLWDRLGLPGMDYVFGVLEDPPTILLTRSGRRLTRWVDTLNYWRVPLREVRGAVAEKDLDQPAPGAPDSDHHFVCRRRNRVVEDLVCRMIQILEETQLCGLQSTAASTAWAAYRRSYMTSGIFIHGNKDAIGLERSSLAGGRPQVWKTGCVNQPTCALDVNSLYPHVMASEPQPCKLVSFQYETTVQELHQALQGYHVVAEVLLFAEPSGRDPISPLRVPSHGGRPIFYLGGRELSRAVHDYGVAAVGWMVRYERADLFSHWVRDLYPKKVAAREKNDFAECLFWKMLLNGLPGKFAQKKRGWLDDNSIPCPDYWGYFWSGDLRSGSRQRCRAIAGVAQRLSEGGEVRNSFPALTASICGSARCELREHVQGAGETQVWYTDTDCLHTSLEGFERLQSKGSLHPTRIGLLKELARGEDSYYWGPKHYRVGDYWVSNVIQADAEEVTRGVYLQSSKQGLGQVLTCPLRDRVFVKSREVTVGPGPSA